MYIRTADSPDLKQSKKKRIKKGKTFIYDGRSYKRFSVYLCKTIHITYMYKDAFICIPTYVEYRGLYVNGIVVYI